MYVCMYVYMYSPQAGQPFSARRLASCRRRQRPVCEQKMADLPVDRLTPDQPPFTSVGVDYFGPFQVKPGRSLVKRYGVMFTYLAIRWLQKRLR